MITEQGIVKNVSKNRAFVSIQRSSCCSSCDSQGVCRTLSDKEMLVETLNDLDAKAGDHVEIAVPTGSFLKVTFFVYFLPIVLLMIGALLGWHYAPALNLDPTLASAGAGAITLAACFTVLRYADRQAGRRDRLIPRITRILPVPQETPLADSR